jgi:tetratricopeptide (TPR) repeat protein
VNTPLAHAGNVPRALSMYQQLNREDPDNPTYGKALKRLRALVNGREAGNTAFKEGRYQQAYDECATSIWSHTQLLLSSCVQLLLVGLLPLLLVAHSTSWLVPRYTRSLNGAQDLRNTYVAQVATNRANVCLKLNRAQDAVRDAELAIGADKDFAKAYLRRAQAYEQLANWAEAVRDYNTVKQLDKQMTGIDNMLRNAQVELKKAKRVDYYKVRLRLSSVC